MDRRTQETVVFLADEIALNSRCFELDTDHGNLRLTPKVRAVAVEIAVEPYRRAGVRACEFCACTERFACEGGCGWAYLNVCTSCVPKARRSRR